MYRVMWLVPKGVYDKNHYKKDTNNVFEKQ